MSVADLAVEVFAHDLVALEAEHVNAVAEAATYRQLLVVALEQWEVDRRQRLGAEARLRQAMGLDPWQIQTEDAGE